VTTIQSTSGAQGGVREAKAGTSGPRPAQRAPELAPLALEDLRTYRQELIIEESRVSYWRRILQARLDLALGESSLSRLRGVLTEHQESSRRLALQMFDDPNGTPPLPDLAVLWEIQAGTAGEGDALLARLAAAEHQLSAYRSSLHVRLDAATGELISRYRDEPSLALRALPLPRGNELGVA